jgi:LacI family transcriptional regulator
MHPRRKRVALLIETSTTWGRGLIRGIARYAHERANWALSVEPRGTHERQILPYNWQGDGVIGRLTSHEIVESIKKEHIPAVNVSQISIPDTPFPKVTTDESRVGQLAAKHLLQRNFSSLGYYGPPHRPHYTDHIFEAFQEQAKRCEVKLSVFHPDRYFATAQSSHDDLMRLEHWLMPIEKPVGILAWNATGAFKVISACEVFDLRVPDQVGVLAGENDELLESISGVSMTAIDHHPSEVGWHAAARLDRLLQGTAMERTTELIEPRGIRLGDSTTRSNSNDVLVEETLESIRRDPSHTVSIAEIAEKAGLSRRALEVRFNKAIGQSPAAEIRTIRLEHACRLLASTSCSIGSIAAASGFQSIDSFSRAFANKYGMPPRDYRKQASKTVP